MSIDPVYLIYAAMLVSVVLIQINRRTMSPIITLVNRWLRWGIFATGGAYIFWWLQLTNHPYWVLVAIFAALWFLGETLHNWIAIKALSASDRPLSTKFSASDSGEEWPTQPRFLKMRDELRARNFTHVQSVRSEIIEGVYMRMSVYHDARAETRLQITFIPHPSGAMVNFSSCASVTSAGHRFVTDNAFMPFAGFYPDTYFLERNPWRCSLAGLLDRHAKRLAQNGEPLVAFTTNPVDELNNEQNAIEQLNVKLGFFRPYHEREEFGKFTSAACYRVWKEMWTLSYLGRSARYV